MKPRVMCRTALVTALLCVVGPMTIPVGPVPLSLATLAVYLAGAILGAKHGTMAVTLYILIGAAGVPVFSGFSGGLQQLVGPTGGFLAGYLACAAMIGYIAEKKRRKWLSASMILGTVICYALGTVWFMAQTGLRLEGALVSCVIPFLPGDIMKIAAAMAVVSKMKRD